jgi:xylan 1,4-beta-xylosidase
MNPKLCLALILARLAFTQAPVVIHVDTSQKLGGVRSRVQPIWAYFGYDEPNYTYAPNGAKLISELGDLLPSAVYIRTHNLLTTGDGMPALKWGSTNAYTEDASGKPIYDWTITDRIFDIYLAAHARPFVEIGFMPEALSIHPQPYRHTWPKGGIDTGWAYPPKDYAKWGELVYQWARHCSEKYGSAEASSWYWEVWNEPDIMYWHGTAEEYDKLYDAAVAGVRRALPNALVGGPASTGPGAAHAAEFLRQFLEHCDQTGAPLDFITFHAKGRPQMVDGNVRMGISHELRDAAKGFEIVASFAKFRKLPIILSEADPEGCAACSAKEYPQNAYRNGTLYAAYTAAAMDAMLQLAARYQINLRGLLTWAFEFEGQPYFAGFRTLATNGVDKPVLNVFRMASMLHGDTLRVDNPASLPLDELLEQGARGKVTVGARASVADRSATVLLWNYSDDSTATTAPVVELRLDGLQSKHMRYWRYAIDETHSNSYSVWKAMGSPQTPDAAQYRELELSGKLQFADPPRKVAAKDGKLQSSFTMPPQSVSLVGLSW